MKFVLTLLSICSYIVDSSLIMLHFHQTDLANADYLTTYYGFLKGCLLVNLGVYYYSIATKINFIFILYIIFAFIGDIFLMSYDFTIYIIGGIFFLLSHITLTLYFHVDFRKISIKALVLMLPGISLHAFILYPHCLLKKNSQSICFLLYSFVLELAAASSIGREYKYAKGLLEKNVFLIALGYFIFLISDLLLLYKEITQIPDNLKYAIMLTYIVAQFLIVTGLGIMPHDEKKTC